VWRKALAIGIAAASIAVSLSCSSAQTSVTTPSTSKCQIQVSSSTSSFPSSGGSGTVTVSTTPDCTWTVTSNAGWVSISGSSSGQGDATITYSVATNPAPSPRSGGIGVSPDFVSLNQAGAPCLISLSRPGDSMGSAGGHLSFGVSALTGCSWSASTNDGWISVTSGQNGNGNGSIGLSIAANTGSQRAGQVHVGSQTYTVTQAASHASPPPPPPPPVTLDGQLSKLAGLCPVVTFDVDAKTVVTAASTVFRRETCAELRNGQDVSVTGVTQVDQSVLASTVQAKDEQ
jgi:hypothetical protein